MLSILLTLVLLIAALFASYTETKLFQYESDDNRGVLEKGAPQSSFQRQWNQPLSHPTRVRLRLGAYSNEEICANFPVDAPYYTSHGVFYVVECYRGHSDMVLSNDFGHTQSQARCLEICDQVQTCKGACYAYNTLDNINCLLLSEAPGPSNYPSYRGAYIYRIDPPTQPTPDEDLVPCSKTCPSCNGLSYTSTVSERTFRMNCGKRHGSPVIAKNLTEDFASCIETCALQSHCRSVDYQEITKTCYQSAHHGEPTIIIPGFSSAYVIEESDDRGECPQPVPPPTCPLPPTCPVPAPPTPPLMPDVSCGNQGLGFAVYPNTLPNGKPNPKTDKSYSSFIPSRFNYQIPEFTGVASVIAITDARSLYGYKPKDYQFTAVNYKGYLYAPFAGDYTFSIPKADGIALLWVGPSAKFNWTRATTSLTQIHPPALSNVYNATFAAGEYVEIRAVWGNGGGSGEFRLEVTGPVGVILVDGSKVSPFLLQFSCDDGKKAARWNDWGNEFEGTPSIFTQQHQGL